MTQPKMKNPEMKTASTQVFEDAKTRCYSLINRLNNTNNISPSPKSTLLRLIQSELTFLNRTTSPPTSLNIGYLESVVHVLTQPFITSVSRVCKPIRLSPSISVHVDVVCCLNGNPVWFVVSDRNRKHISWECGKDKGLKRKIEQVVGAARLAPIAIRPCSVVLFFANGVGSDAFEKVVSEFGGVSLEFMEGDSCEEVEEGWVSVESGRTFSEACVVEIKVGDDNNGDGMERKNEGLGCAGVVARDNVLCKRFDEYSIQDMGTSLGNMVSGMECWCCSLSGECEPKLVNFDTTAMVAIVSGISNDGTEKILATPESELRGRFKGNYEFVIAQVTAEKQNPIFVEFLDVSSQKRGIICESVHSEFQDLISMVGGPSEKLRAAYLLKFLKLVPDSPSARLMSLPTTRNLALKNKVVFGTGDYWNAPTVTANMAFVRAVEQAGVSLSVIKHRPRALVGH